MPAIIIKGSRFVGGGGSDTWSRQKDELHRKRKEHAEILGESIFSKDKMDMRDCHSDTDEARRTQEYDKWKATEVKGMTNEQRMKAWSDLNRKFKERGEEGLLHSPDDIRNGKVKYN